MVKLMNENQMVNQASIGMLSILHACEQFKIKKLVLCSAGSNIVGTAWKRKQGDESPYSEADFSVV